MKAGNGGILRPLALGNPRAEVRSGDRLRRLVARVPMVLVPRMENLPQVARHVRADQRAAVEDGGDLLQPLRDADIVDRRRDRGKGAQHPVRFEPFIKGDVALRVERLGVGHAAGHPQEHDAIGRRRDFFVLAAFIIIGPEDAGPTGGQHPSRAALAVARKSRRFDVIMVIRVPAA